MIAGVLGREAALHKIGFVDAALLDANLGLPSGRLDAVKGRILDKGPLDVNDPPGTSANL